MSEEGVYRARVLPSICTFLLVIQLVYWSMLFDSTSFYVTLVIQSFADIIAFMAILTIILLAFSSGIHVLDQNNKQSHNYLFDR